MKMNTSVHLVTIIVLVALGELTAAGKLPNLRTINRNEDNMINPGRKIGGGHRKQDWLKVTQVSPNLVHTGLGERLELHCEVIGSPPPTIQWIRGNNPAQQAELMEGNHIIDHISSGMAKTQSILAIDCVMPQHEGLYTCVATAGVKTTLAQPSMVLIPDNHINNLTALLSACPSLNNMHVERAPRIIQWSPVLMDDIGNDVTLPCRAEGYPTPSVDWLVGDNEMISENDSRFKVLPDGDLLIMKLRWSDMGEYTCVASSPRGRDSTETYVYPVLVKNNS